MLKKDLDVEGLYSAVEAIPKDVRFLAGLTNLVWVQANEYLEPTVEDTCLSINPPPPNSKRKSTRYDASYFEYLMWMTSLASMSWLLTNVKKKSEHGQCHNPIHKETQEKTGYTRCAIGSACHSKFYDNIVYSLEGLLKYATEHRPTVLEKEKVNGKKDT